MYWQPQLAVNYPVSKAYSHNVSLANRTYLVNMGESKFKTRQIDIAHFSKFSLQDNQSIALGVQYRFRNIFENKSNELRFTQQYNFTHRPLAVRYGHRLRTEQRITSDLTIHRFRYRFNLDFPLKGEKLDIGEPFLVIGNENLLSVSKGNSPEYDIRLNSQLGWKFDKGLKLLIGMEYRLEDYTSTSPQNVLFLLTSMQLSL
ncbi:MAG: DUF2490 domain-containing protein [Allomuricauda sp.]